jgi:hypothetical protein
MEINPKCFKTTGEFLDQMSNYQLATDFHLTWMWMGLKLGHYFARLPSK